MGADERSELGKSGEALVAAKLASQGFVILGRNVRVGRLELDVIARRGGLVVVCEVRSRRSSGLLEPWQTIDRKKIERVRRATAQWLRESRLGGVTIRFDAASVVFDRDPPRIDYFEEAF